MSKLKRVMKQQRHVNEERMLGDRLFAEGLVQICGVDESLLIALVGEVEHPQVVLFDLFELANGEISVACNCAGRDPIAPCRHVCALFRELQETLIRELFPDQRSFQISFDQELLDEIDSFSVDELREFALENQSTISQARNSFAGQLALFDEERATPQESFERAISLTDEGAMVPWYILDVAASTLSDSLSIRVMQGYQDFPLWRSFRRECLDEPSLLASSEDRILLALLSLESDEESMSMRRPGDFERRTNTTVPAAVHPLAAEQLGRSGRCRWILDSSMDHGEARSVTWNQNARYELRLHVEDNPDRGGWTVAARLHDGEKAISPADANLLLSSGLMLHDDQLSMIDWKGTESCRRLFLARPELFARYQEQKELIGFLYRFPPEVSQPWPPNLQRSTHRKTPQPIVRLKSVSDGLFRNLGGSIVFRYMEGIEIGPADKDLVMEDIASDGLISRDLDFEMICHRQLAKYGHLPPQTAEYADVDLIFPEGRLREMTEYLSEHQWIVEWNGKRLRKVSQVSYSVSSGMDWFDLSADIDYDGILAELPALLAAVRRREQFVELSDGSRGLVPHQLLEQIQKLAQLGNLEASAVRFAPSQALLIDSLLADVEHTVDRDSFFARFTTKLRAFDGIKPKSPPRSFQGTLRPYQRVGLGWLNFLKEFHLGGCLADDMGLGKTIQVLCLLEARRVRKLRPDETRLPSLVVVPKSLVFNWIDEARKFVPKLRIRAYQGNDRAQVLKANDFDLLVTTYGTMRRDVERLAEMQFDYVILDEAQAIKNPLSQTARASRVLRATHRLALTGTPIENHLGELWSLFEFLNPGILGSATAFKNLTSQPNEDARALRLIRDTVAPFILRRTKEVVLDDLPEKSEQIFYCELETKQRKLYDQLRNYYRQSLDERVQEVGMAKAKIHVLEALLRLRQVACHPALVDQKYERVGSAKLDALMEQLVEVSVEGHKSLVFSQFTGYLDLIRKRLDRQKIEYCYLDGATNNRGDVVNQFQKEDRFSVFLISLKAGGHGLNLTAADYVYLMDPWWNPAVEAQAIDRAHRLGQKRAVFAYRMIARDTVEERILELQARKKELAEAIISNNQSLLQRLTAEDLRRLLS